MIENLCSRKDQPHIHTTTLPYATNPIKQNFSESLADCEQIAMDQLNYIGYYMKDFRTILQNFTTNKPRNTEDELSEDDQY